MLRPTLILIACLLLPQGANSSPSQPNGRFFYEGNGSFTISNQHTGKKATVQYRNTDGTYNRQAMDQLNLIFGVPAKSLQEDVSLRLIAMLDYLEDRYSKGQTIQLFSGYRSPKYNENLRKQGRLAGKTSYHLYAMATDVIFPGANPKEIWEYVRGLDCCGVGYYHGDKIHVDSGKPRFWTSETALPKTKEPPLNKNIYLATDKDIYHPGEKMQLFLSAISDLPIGIKTKFHLMQDGKKIQSFKPQFRRTADEGKCFVAKELKDARLIYWEIPKKLKKITSDKLGIEVEFCEPTYENMPPKVVSKQFKIE